ncbi:Crp/Fnr family transcriptional regulator [Marinospirillum insulare]|uniref:Transcriptional regulator n=1 Tax=Marinospirillum insulare TaxID=217169 RepID=A0ABQ5ZYC4_9GAMM|nr:Crp/Fnr family transcriptional regulator [Marinospirillum insulare]GLR64017.1 transcriptional regulator [Marinospirillum insulare]
MNQPKVNFTATRKPIRNCVLPSIACKKHSNLGPVNGLCDMRCLVRSHPLFKKINKADFEIILTKARHHELQTHTSIYSEGEVCERFYLVIEGAVKLFTLAEDGTERIVGNATKLQAIGEHEVFTDEKTFGHFAETTTPTRLISFSAQLYLKTLERNNLSALSFLSYLAEKRSKHFTEIEVVTTGNARQRVITYLKSICDKNTLATTSNIVLPIPKYQIASYLGMKPETFSRILSDLKENNLISTNKREIIINDPELFLTNNLIL